jgi:hypothetical protein
VCNSIFFFYENIESSFSFSYSVSANRECEPKELVHIYCYVEHVSQVAFSSFVGSAKE